MIRPCSHFDTAGIGTVINQAAPAYRGVIPAYCWREPYMPERELLEEIAAGVQFWGWQEDSGSIIAVMGIQKVQDVTLIRHAYVLPLPSEPRDWRGTAVHTARLIQRKTAGWHMGRRQLGHPLLPAARLSFRLVPRDEKDRLISSYWKISQRQREASVVLVYAGSPTLGVAADRER